MSGTAPSLSLALRWIIGDMGLSGAELALMAGVSPGAVAAFLERPHAPTVTWMTLAAALRCRVEVRTTRQAISIALPRLSVQRQAHERRQWEARRLTAFRSQILRQSPQTPASAAHTTAQGYVAASASRLAGELIAARARLDATRVETHAVGCRAALRAVADAAQVNAEDLALLAGVSLSAAQGLLDDDAEGRMATPHRLFSALAARLVLQPAGGGAVQIDLAPPGAWRPEPPRPGVAGISHDEMRSRSAQGESLASIARDAGVSRQRVHAIVRGSV